MTQVRNTELPAVDMISSEVMEATLLRASDLLEEMAPPAAAALAVRGLVLEEAIEETDGDTDVLQIADVQMLAAALFHCVQVLEMIRAAAVEIPDETFPAAG
jgi:hypothetical protein